MLRKSVIFASPQQVEVIREPLPPPGPGQLLVETEVSAISAGTEMLFYRGQVPRDLPVDAALASLGQEAARYPLRYGYACVGRVIEAGPRADTTWSGRRVFAFHPHTSHFWADSSELLPVPAGLASERAALLPTMETAVNLVMDGHPLLGERVAIVGQGIVGLLTLALLRLSPLEWLAAVDPAPQRQALALQLGADECIELVDGRAPGTWQPVDLTFELSGNPAALNTAIALTGFGGRVVIGSWYGDKQAPLQLGGAFHRSRIRLLASQVSTIDPNLSGRWDKARRFAWAWKMLERLPIDCLVSHRVAVDDAPALYAALDSQPQNYAQVLLTY